MRHWERKQGKATLRIEAGSLLNPTSNNYDEVGLPYGTKSEKTIQIEKTTKNNSIITVPDNPEKSVMAKTTQENNPASVDCAPLTKGDQATEATVQKGRESKDVAATVKAVAKTAKAEKPKKPKNPNFLGRVGEKFRIDASVDGVIVVGRYAGGIKQHEQVGTFTRKIIQPLLAFDNLQVPALVETVEMFSGGAREFTCLFPLSPHDEARLLAEGRLKPKNTVVDSTGQRFLRGVCTLPRHRVLKELTSPLERTSEVAVLWLQVRQVLQSDMTRYWDLEGDRMESLHCPPVAAIAIVQQAKADQRAWHKHRRNQKSGW